MAYIGKINKSTSTLATQTMDSMTGDGTTTTLSLTSTPLDVNDVSIYTDGVMQEPGVDYTLDGNTVTFTTAVPLNCYVCACQTQNGDIGTPAADSVTTDKLTDGMFTDSHISSLSASKLTGALPVLDGSAITGVGTGFMENASDPAVDTNPADGLGAVWVNTTTGNIYICTDATADANVWTNVGEGSGDITAYGRPWLGTAFGYQAGGATSNSYTDSILKYSFTSDGNSIDVGNLTQTTDGNACHSSETYGYAATGDHPVTTLIWKWSFSSDGDAVLYGGQLTAGGWGTTGTYTKTHGYCWGRNNSGPHHNLIDKFNYASEDNATDVGDMTQPGSYISGQSTDTYGYCSGGGPGSHDNVIDRVSVSTDGNATDVGDIIGNYGYVTGAQSKTHGYVSGGMPSTQGSTINNIQKFQFAATSNASDIADLLNAAMDMAGSSSETHGYCSGGRVNNSTPQNVIQKFSTTSDANSTDVGDLSISVAIMGGCQY